MMNNGTTTEIATVQAGEKKLLSVTDKQGEVHTRLTHRAYTHVCITDWERGKCVTWHCSLKNARPPYYLKGCQFHVVEVA